MVQREGGVDHPDISPAAVNCAAETAASIATVTALTRPIPAIPTATTVHLIVGKSAIGYRGFTEIANCATEAAATVGAVAAETAGKSTAFSAITTGC